MRHEWLYPPRLGILLAWVLQPIPVCLEICGSLSQTDGCSHCFFLVCRFRSTYHTDTQGTLMWPATQTAINEALTSTALVEFP